ncbi:MAG: response regulator transcription factor [Gammaproteobacteria bacterium]|nr:response regulator transcription factor [Gammaproteobacteria bacterium]
MHTKASILIASGSTSLAERFSGILANEFLLEVLNQEPSICSYIAESHPHLVILDPALFNESLAATITKILETAPHTRIIVLKRATGNPVDQMSLFKTGAHGFCAVDILPDLLIKAAHAVCHGEIWVPRQLITQLIGELADENSAGTQKLSRAVAKSVACLTPRELQVAQMVHLGGNNKVIARELEISERTVKAHLSAIFRKLNIENRLHLALYFNKVN